MSIETILDNRGLIKGFLTPLFYEEGTDRAALGPVDFDKVRQGYACPRCLAEFSICLVQCPLCELTFDSARDLEDPDPLHVEHLRERETTAGRDMGRVNTFDDFMRKVERDKNIDHVPLSKLKPRKRH